MVSLRFNVDYDNDTMTKNKQTKTTVWTVFHFHLSSSPSNSNYNMIIVWKHICDAISLFGKAARKLCFAENLIKIGLAVPKI